jgi:hypothetical protein
MRTCRSGSHTTIQRSTMSYLDDATGEGICVIDLDTVMPGLIHYDFGDMVRTATCPAAEDERDLVQGVSAVPDVRSA